MAGAITLTSLLLSDTGPRTRFWCAGGAFVVVQSGGAVWLQWARPL